MKAKTLTVSTAALIALFGCATVDVYAPPCPDIQMTGIPDKPIRMNTVNLLDWSIRSCEPREVYSREEGRIESAYSDRSKIIVESSDSRRTPTGTLEVWAVLRNRTDFPLQVEGRTRFFDSHKAPADKPTSWQRIHLPPQSIGTYKDSSTQTEGVDYYYIEIREGR